MSKGLSQLGDKSQAGMLWPDLASEGWERRSVTDPVRAPELTALYESLGFEVKTMSSNPTQFPGDCEGCAASCATKIFVFTRKIESGINHE